MSRTLYACTLALLPALAMPAHAASFTMSSFDCGSNIGGFGSPITWTSGSSTPSAPGLIPPTAADIIFDPPSGRVNYFAMDPLSLSSNTYTSNRDITVVAGSVFGPGSASGIAFSNTPVHSGPGDRIVVMSVVLRTAAAESLSTAGVLVSLDDAGSGGETLGSLRFGLANASNNGGLWAQSYYLDAAVIPDTSGGFPTFVQYEISVVAVPAPSTAALGIIAGFYTRRRAR